MKIKKQTLSGIVVVSGIISSLFFVSCSNGMKSGDSEKIDTIVKAFADTVDVVDPSTNQEVRKIIMGYDTTFVKGDSTWKPASQANDVR